MKSEKIYDGYIAEERGSVVSVQAESQLYFSDRMLQAMHEAFSFPMTIVEAPMGYGKTTAVREILNRNKLKNVWLRVYDHSTLNFWSCFSDMIGKVDLEVGKKLEELGFPDDMSSIQQAISILAGMVLPEKTFFVIDDYHCVENEEVDAFFEQIIWSELTDLHFIITARYVQLKALDELKLKGYIKHILKDVFEFSAPEIKAYYKLCGIKLLDSEVKVLMQYTEGWISALYLTMLEYRVYGAVQSRVSIERLVEKAIYDPLPERVQRLLVTVSIFDSFTLKLTEFMLDCTDCLTSLNQLIARNAFVNYDAKEKTYHLHSIIRTFLKEKFDGQDASTKADIYRSAAQWCLNQGNYLNAMHYAYEIKDYETILTIVERDKGHSLNSDNKDEIIRYFETCPFELKAKYPFAVLVYLRRLFTFNERALFQKVCAEFLEGMASRQKDDLDFKNQLLGEFELILSFAQFNDIEKMSLHHQKACALMKEPSAILGTTASWTFGSPSVLYMFYRKSGDLKTEVDIIRRAMPYYYKVTSNHGFGAERIMEAEHYFNLGDFDNAEIGAYKAYETARATKQSGILICCIFLQIRLAFLKGDFEFIMTALKKMRADMEAEKWYLLLHTVDMCEAYVFAALKAPQHIPNWILSGSFDHTRLFFPTLPFLNIVYGRILMIQGAYLKLIGSSEQFLRLSAVFPNVLAQIYTHIYTAGAYLKIYRQEEAYDALSKALDLAMPDEVYMPFVENGDFIMPLLMARPKEAPYTKAVETIKALYSKYADAQNELSKAFVEIKRPSLTARELEIARLAASGHSNREIAEKLYISQNTVKTLLKSVFEKLGINSRALLNQHLES